LTVTYVVALAAGLIVFAAFSLTLTEEVLKSSVDSRMGASARAFVGSLVVSNGVVNTDAGMRRRLRRILSPQQNAAIIRSDGMIAMQSGAIPPEVVAVARRVRGDSQFASVRAAGTPLRVLSVPVPDAPDTLVVLWRPVDFIADYRRTGLIVFGGTILAIVATAFSIGSLVARRGLEPLSRMAHVASEIEGRDLSRRLTTAMQDEELAQFCSAFNRMLDRLQYAFEQQRQFTADASHELRAPLAVIRAEAELSLRRPRDVESYRESMRSIQGEVAHLEDLIDALLVIARTEAGNAEMKYFDVSVLAQQAMRRMERFAAAKETHVKSSITQEALVLGDPDQFERILASLLHNAVKFGRPGGTVDVVVSAAPHEVNVLIRDDGPGFSDEARARAFDRFWRGNSSEARGSGLGLTIAKSAIERWGGNISVANAPHGGGQISITLPSPGLQ
jgi:two-component system OmpR family sensor kinase